MIELAVQLIEKKSGPFEPDEVPGPLRRRPCASWCRRSSRATRSSLRTRRRAPKGGNIVDLMEALKRSIGDSGKSKKVASSRKRA